MNTQCNSCVFAEKKDNEMQTGCMLNRHKKLGINIINDEGFYVLDRFCTTFRPQNWLDDLSVQESADICQTVLSEIYPRVGFFVMLDTEEDGIDSLKKTISDIKKQDINARYVVVITDKVEYNEEVHEYLRQTFDYDITEFHIVQLVEKIQFMPMVIDEAFSHAKNGWVYFCHAGEEVDTNLIYKINKRVNLDLKKLVVVEPYDDNLNGLLFQAALFKFLNGNNPKIFQDEVSTDLSFIDKVKEASKNSDPETMITWEKFNES